MVTPSENCNGVCTQLFGFSFDLNSMTFFCLLFDRIIFLLIAYSNTELANFIFCLNVKHFSSFLDCAAYSVLSTGQLPVGCCANDVFNIKIPRNI